MLLEDCNVNINANGGHYGTALQAAVKSQSRELVRLLLDHGADPNIIGGEFGTALHAAAVCRWDDLCSILIDTNADVNAVSNCDTALHLAARNKHNKLVKLLLEKGVNPAAVGADGRTALHLAAMNGHDGVVKLLLETGASSDTTLRQVAATRQERVRLLLAEADGGINRKDFNGDVPLSLAAANEHKAVANLLLANGADIASCGDAVLRIAIRTKDISLMEVLIKKGADVNARDPNGQTERIAMGRRVEIFK
jgi:ankyrin repeat protein